MRLSVRDYVVTGIIVLLAGVLLYFYFQERGRTTVYSNETPLGTIVFKKLSATRRARGSLMWERMRNNGPVYRADTLRTADASEASVCFDDGTSLDMLEDSMLRLEFIGANRTVEFLGGDIAISNTAGAQNSDLSGLTPSGRKPGQYTITAAGRTIALSDSSQASLSRSGDTLSVDVSQGQVGVTQANGASATVGGSQELQMNLTTGTSRIVEHTVTARLPEQNARLLSEGSDSPEIEFSWQADQAGAATVELADNKDFNPIQTSASATGSSARMKVDAGSWYWRVRTSAGATSSTRRFSLFTELAPQPILPATGEQVSYRKTLPDIRFSWSEMPDATAYVFEVAQDPQFTKPVRRNRTATSALTVNTLGEGTWYWRVHPVYAMSLLGSEATPEVRVLTVSKRAEMEALTPTMPLPGAMFLIQEATNRGVAISWPPDPEAVEYQVAVSRSRDMSNPVVEAEHVPGMAHYCRIGRHSVPKGRELVLDGELEGPRGKPLTPVPAAATSRS